MSQENVFLLYATGLGAFITFVYDCLRIFRRVIPHKILLISLEDLIFWGFCAIEVFLLMYREGNGTLRWFAVFGAMAGMFLYKKTLSAPFVQIVSRILQKILQVLSKIWNILTKPVKRIGHRAGKLAKKVLKYYWKVIKMKLCKQ